MLHDGHNKYEKFAQILTIIASILTVIASIFAILGLQVFKSTVIVPREVITPNVDSDKFDKQTDFFVEVKTRLADTDDKNWYHTIDAQVGEKVEFQIQYRNISKRTQEDVVIKDILPENMQYVEDSTILFNFNHPDGLDMLDEAEGIDRSRVIDSGINIGHYKPGANAYVRFSAVVIDKSLETDSNTLVNWSQASVDKVTLQDYACVHIQLSQ